MRIVAGRFRGHRLAAPKGRATRPTGERVREAIFNILGPAAVRGARVADLFAGTGALGLEALSRGAAWCDFYERERSAVDVLRRNIEHVRAEGEARVIGGALPQTLGPGEAYDLVLIDPPWATHAQAAAVERLMAVGRLSARGMVVVEHAVEAPMRADAIAALGLTQLDARRYGDTGVQILAPRGHDGADDTEGER